jgi:hypothetical protein
MLSDKIRPTDEWPSGDDSEWETGTMMRNSSIENLHERLHQNEYWCVPAVRISNALRKSSPEGRLVARALGRLGRSHAGVALDDAWFDAGHKEWLPSDAELGRVGSVAALELERCVPNQTTWRKSPLTGAMKAAIRAWLVEHELLLVEIAEHVPMNPYARRFVGQELTAMKKLLELI